MQDYQPIACILHERLEFSVLRRIPLMLEYRRFDECLKVRVMPLDVVTRNGAEWLKFQKPDGSREKIRLDRIISFEEVLS
ncbi:MAG: transcriptional antiterminator, Rof [Sulfuricella sp.]